MTKVAKFYVTNSADSAKGSLRWAVQRANQHVQAKIVLTESITAPIQLLTQIAIQTHLKIVNQASHNVVIRSTERIFHVTKQLELDGAQHYIVLEHGLSLYNGGAMYSTAPVIGKKLICRNNKAFSNGGAIYSESTILLIDCLFKKNVAGLQGGSIYSQSNVTLQRCQLIKNRVVNEKSAGAAIFINQGQLIACATRIEHNSASLTSGNAGAIFVVMGDINLNDCQVNHNTSYNFGAILVGYGNIDIVKSQINHNQATNPNPTNGGGGGIAVIQGTTKVNQSSISHNVSQSMYASGILSIIGQVIVEDSQFDHNVNRGPGPAIACNVNGSLIAKACSFCHNSGASIGSAIVNFTVAAGSISLNDCQVNHNQLSNYQTIGQTIDVFLQLIAGLVDSLNYQAQASGGSALATLQPILANVILQAQEVNAELAKIPRTLHDTIAGTVASLLLGPILIETFPRLDTAEFFEIHQGQLAT